MAGDFLNNLRSTLDHLVSQVVIAEGGTPGKHHGFPIAVTEAWWKSNITHRNPNRRTPSPLDGIAVNGPAWKLIRDAQPCVGRDEATAARTPLAVLARLNNADKHRQLNLTSLSMGDKFEIKIGAPFRLIGGHLPLTGTAIEPNKEFGWLKIELVGVDQADIELKLPVEVAFDGVLHSDFRLMFEEVKGLVVEFERLLG